MSLTLFSFGISVVEMASKRRRGEGSSSSPSKPFDKKKIVSAEAQERYNRMSQNTLIPERGLRPDQIIDGEVAVMIVERDWFDFTSHPDPTVTAVVKEFHANAKEHYHFGVQVRGKTVEFSSTDINKYYNLEDRSVMNPYITFVCQG